MAAHSTQSSSHRGEISSSFLTSGYRAACSCGWIGAQTYPSSTHAEEALHAHLRAVAKENT